MLLHLAIAFLSAALVAYNSIYSNERFNSYFFLFYRHWSVIVYTIIYGVIGVLLYLLLKAGVLSVTVKNITVVPQVMLAAVIGIAAKGVVNIILFNIRHGGESVPVGLHTITRVIDDYFEGVFDAVCYSRMVGFCDAEVQQLQTIRVQQLKQQVVRELASHPAKDKVATFAQSIKNVTTHKEILNSLLCNFGKTTYWKVCKRVELEC